jgi:hypothetical protein
MKPETRRILDEIDAADEAIAARFRDEPKYLAPVQGSLPLSVSMDGQPMGDPHPCDMTTSELDRALGVPVTPKGLTE